MTPDLAAELDTLHDECRERAAQFWEKTPLPRNRAELVKLTGELALEILSQPPQVGAAFRKRSRMSAEDRKVTLEFISRVLALVIDSRKEALLAAQCADFTLGTMVQGSVTQQDIANQHGLGKAAVSKRCRLMCDELGVPPSAAMRTQEACENYAIRQQGKRTVVERSPWRFAEIFSTSMQKAAAA